MNRPRFLVEVVVLEHVLKISDGVVVTAEDQRHAREPWPKWAVGVFVRVDPGVGDAGVVIDGGVGFPSRDG